jgi:hypothetical protein
MRPVVRQIKFQRGSVCYQFTGVATEFRGVFKGRQRIVARVRTNSEGMISADLVRSGKFVRSFETTELFGNKVDFKAPTSGEYRFGVSPCSDWGTRVQFNVCAI